MKNKIFIAIAGAILLLVQQPANGQLITKGSPSNWFGQPDNTPANQSDWIRSIGIGYFDNCGGTVTYPNSVLHVNTNFNCQVLPQNNSIASFGEVFRTDAPHTSGNNTFWRMYHGGTQRFNINHGYNNDYVSIGTVQNEHLYFFTNNNSAPYMTILGAPVSGVGQAGNMGIGTAAPKERLEVNGNILANGKILVAADDTVYDLLAIILRLQNEVNELKAQLTTLK